MHKVEWEECSDDHPLGPYYVAIADMGYGITLLRKDEEDLLQVETFDGKEMYLLEWEPYPSHSKWKKKATFERGVVLKDADGQDYLSFDFSSIQDSDLHQELQLGKDNDGNL